MLWEPDGQDFLRKIKSEPDNYDLKLIFADWLDEHNHPLWAKMIRERASRKFGDYVDKYELFRSDFFAWIYEYHLCYLISNDCKCQTPNCATCVVLNTEFKDGFLTSFKTTLKEFFDNSHILFKLTKIDKIFFTDVPISGHTDLQILDHLGPDGYEYYVRDFYYRIDESYINRFLMHQSYPMRKFNFFEMIKSNNRFGSPKEATDFLSRVMINLAESSFRSQRVFYV